MDLFTTKEAADYLIYISESSLKQSRHRGRLYGKAAPRHIEIGNNVFYEKKELDWWKSIPRDKDFLPKHRYFGCLKADFVVSRTPYALKCHNNLGDDYIVKKGESIQVYKNRLEMIVEGVITIEYAFANPENGFIYDTSQKGIVRVSQRTDLW